MAARSTLRVPALILLATGTLAAQRTWVVDQFGSGDFLDIPPAVAAAATRDIVLVRVSGRIRSTSRSTSR
jgi:hypothetical protein